MYWVIPIFKTILTQLLRKRSIIPPIFFNASSAIKQELQKAACRSSDGFSKGDSVDQISLIFFESFRRLVCVYILYLFPFSPIFSYILDMYALAHKIHPAISFVMNIHNSSLYSTSPPHATNHLSIVRLLYLKKGLN